MQSVNVLIFIANGTEELEAITIIDLLRRAGAGVLIAGLTDRVTCSRNVRIMPDMLLSDLTENEFDAVIVPGGKAGVDLMCKNEKVLEILKLNSKKGKLIGAICARTLVLKEAKVLTSRSKITSHPTVRDEFFDYQYFTDKVVSHGNMITSRGAGTALEFTFAIIEKLFGKAVRDKIAQDIIFRQELN